MLEVHLSDIMRVFPKTKETYEGSASDDMRGCNYINSWRKKLQKDRTFVRNSSKRKGLQIKGTDP